MNAPEREPGEMLTTSRDLSGPAPASATFRQSRDHAVSHLCLAPTWAAQGPATPGHGLEIPTTLWGARSARDPDVDSVVLILMGGRCGIDRNRNVREPGFAAT